jgi:DNA polymerase-3 subunit delta
MSNIYLLYGEEKYDINQKIEKIKKEFSNLELGVNFFNVNLDNIDELESITQGVTFFGSEKLIIIRNTNLKFNVNLLKNLDEDIKVIIVEDSVDKRLTEYKTLSKIAECNEYKHLDERQMTQFIIDILKKYNVKISYEDAQYMQSVCGEDKYNNINELQKLVIYVQNGGIVTKEIIDKVCSKTLNAKIFNVLDYIINKKKDIAIEQLNFLLRQKEPIVKIYIMLYKQFKQLYMIKLLKNSGEKNIAEELGIAPFIVKKLSYACDKYTEEELKQIIYAFDDYDKKTKNGDMDFEIGLKKIICML